MTLTNALRTATSSLSSHSRQIANLSRNISGIGDSNYVRRDSEVVTSYYGSTRVDTQRYVDRAVYTSKLLSNSEAEMSTAWQVA